MSNNSIQQYPLSPETRGRLLGVALIALGLIILGFGAIAMLDWLPRTVLDISVILTAIAVLVVVALIGPKHWIVRLDDTGYAVRFIRTAGARSARWVEVNEMEATTVAGARCVVLRLKNGQATTIPVDLIAGGGQPFAEAITAHLKHADRSSGKN